MTLPFENDTSKIVKRLAKRSLQADKRRNLFVIITIIFTTALLSGMFFSAFAGQRELESDIRGQYQALVVDTTQEEIEKLSAQPEIERWGLSQNFGSARYKDSNLVVEYADANWMELGKKPEFTGKLPEKANEILVEQAFLEYFSLPRKTGQTILLNLGDGERDYVVSGIMQVENNSRMFSLVVSRAYLEQAAAGKPLFEYRLRFVGADSTDVNVLKSEIADFLTDNNIAEDRVFYSSNYFDMQGFRNDSVMLYFPIALVFLVASGLVIYSIFFISVRGKLREYGRLKVIGASPRQIRKVIRREGNRLSMCGIPIGLVIGGAVGFAVNPTYWSWLGNLPFALGTALFVVLTVFISTGAPMRMAAKVSPIEAVRTSGYQAEAPKKSSRKIGGHISPNSLARMNFQRSPKKAVITLISLSMTGVFLLCAATMLRSVNVNNMAAASMSDGCNYSIKWGASLEEVPEISRKNPLTKELREKILAVDGVESIIARKRTTANVILPNGVSDQFEIHVQNEEEMAQLIPEDVLYNGISDYAELVKGNGIVITDDSDKFLNMYWDYTPQIGDVVTFKGYGGEKIDFTVMGIADGEASTKAGGGVAMFALPEESAQQLYPDIENMEMVWNVFTDEDTDKLRESLFTLLEDPILNIHSRSDYAQQLEVYLQNTKMLIYGILIFLFFFSMVNLVNTLMTNLFSRQQEFGILQSVGMSGRQLSKMLTAECFCYVIATLLITLAAGGAAGAVMVIVLGNYKIFGPLVYQFPIIELLIFAAALLLVQVLYSVFAVRYMRRQSLVERIKTME